MSLATRAAIVFVAFLLLLALLVALGTSLASATRIIDAAASALA